MILGTNIKRILNKDHWVFWMVFCVVVYFLMLKSPIKAKPFGDGDFHLESKAVASWLLGTGTYETVSISKAPGPVLFYAVPYTIAGSNATDERLLLFARIWTLLLIMIFQLILYNRMFKYYGGVSANTFLLLTFLIPLHFYYALGIWAEGMAYVAMLLILIGFTEHHAKRNWSIFLFIGLLLLAWARPNSLLTFPVLLILSFLPMIVNRIPQPWVLRRRVLVFGMVAASGLFLVKLLPNTRITYYQSDYMAYVQHIGRFQYREETFDWRYWDASTRTGSMDFIAYEASGDSLRNHASQTGVPMRDVFSKWVITDMLEHPFMVFKQFVIRVFTGHLLQSNSINPERLNETNDRKILVYWIGHILINLINLLLIICFVFELKKNGLRTYWILLAPIIALLVFHGLVYMEQRYLFPIRVIYLFLASLFISRFLEKNLLHASKS